MWAVSLVFLAGGGWWSLQTMASDVAKIQQTLDAQATAVTIHTSNPEAHDDNRIKKLETQQAQVAEDVKSLMINQNAICQATNARCR